MSSSTLIAGPLAKMGRQNWYKFQFRPQPKPTNQYLITKSSRRWLKPLDFDTSESSTTSTLYRRTA